MSNNYNDIENRYFGKYRGVVENNVDPANLGRIKAFVPDVFGSLPTGFAMPCFSSSGAFMLPEVNSGVWIEFEGGNLEFPIWTGCFLGSSFEMPEALRDGNENPNMVFQTKAQNSITIYGTLEEGINISAGPMSEPTTPRILITQENILISNGSSEILIEGKKVSINKREFVLA